MLKKIFMKVLDWMMVSFGIFLIVIVLFFLARLPHALDTKKTIEQVAIIHATKLTPDDVMGKNLPPDPGAEADKTVQGIDANTNGIRDDVELAIFREYPNSAKTRAVLLQYALALQMEVVQPILNKETVTAVVSNQSRASDCIGDYVTEKDRQKAYSEFSSFTEFVKTRQFNTQERKDDRNNFLETLGSYSELDQKCDIDFFVLSN